MNNKSMLNEAAEFIKSRQKANLIIILINIAVFIILNIIGNTENASFMMKYGAAYSPLIIEGEYWRLFTSMFLHFSLQHLLFNMLAILVMGDMLEKAVGYVRYLIIYLLGGLTGNLLSLAVDMRTGSYAVSAGASGAVFAVIGACCYLALRQNKEFAGISVKRIGFATVLMLIQGFTETGVDNAAHLGGVLAGFFLAILCMHIKQR